MLFLKKNLIYFVLLKSHCNVNKGLVKITVSVALTANTNEPIMWNYNRWW